MQFGFVSLVWGFACRNLMAKQDMSELGFGRESDTEALRDRSKNGRLDD